MSWMATRMVWIDTVAQNSNLRSMLWLEDSTSSLDTTLDRGGFISKAHSLLTETNYKEISKKRDEWNIKKGSTAVWWYISMDEIEKWIANTWKKKVGDKEISDEKTEEEEKTKWE